MLNTLNQINFNYFLVVVCPLKSDLLVSFIQIKPEFPAKEYVLVRNVKLVHHTEIGLITKVVGIITVTRSEQ